MMHGSVRMARNVAEKQRRDRLNAFINELANTVPLIANTNRRLDKTSILRLSAAFLRLHDSPLSVVSYRRQPGSPSPAGDSCQQQQQQQLLLPENEGWSEKRSRLQPDAGARDGLLVHLSDQEPESLTHGLDGFLIVANADFKLIYVGSACERFLGHQTIDMLGFPVTSFLHPGDSSSLRSALEDLKRELLASGRTRSPRMQFRCRMRERTQPRTEVVNYQIVKISGFFQLACCRPLTRCTTSPVDRRTGSSAPSPSAPPPGPTSRLRPLSSPDEFDDVILLDRAETQATSSPVAATGAVPPAHQHHPHHHHQPHPDLQLSDQYKPQYSPSVIQDMDLVLGYADLLAGSRSSGGDSSCSTMSSQSRCTSSTASDSSTPDLSHMSILSPSPGPAPASPSTTASCSKRGSVLQVGDSDADGSIVTTTGPLLSNQPPSTCAPSPAAAAAAAGIPVQSSALMPQHTTDRSHGPSHPDAQHDTCDPASSSSSSSSSSSCPGSRGPRTPDRRLENAGEEGWCDRRRDDHDHSPKAISKNLIFNGFVEIVPASPMSELSLMDANQEEYVSRISLDGTLLYADHRISLVLGYTPSEVIGKSAYKYILVPDHVISLFAHKLMLSSSNGTGIVVHRLRTRSGGFTYLRSAGCLQYDRLTGKVDHFVCVGRMLSEQEGLQEMQKFVRKFSPHVASDSPSSLYRSLQMAIAPKQLHPDPVPATAAPDAAGIGFDGYAGSDVSMSGNGGITDASASSFVQDPGEGGAAGPPAFLSFEEPSSDRQTWCT